MDTKQFKELFLPFHAKLYHITYAIVQNKLDAEDILQECYLKLWNIRDRLPCIENHEAFAVMMIKNLSIDFIRSAQANNRKIDSYAESININSINSFEKEVEQKDELQRVKLVINSLPANQKEVLLLRSMNDLSYEDIEHITGLSASNIRTLIFRARKFIKDKIAEYERR